MVRGLPSFYRGENVPKSYSMTYVPGQKRWIKVYKGKAHSVSCRQLGCLPSKEASWLAANQWWDYRKKEIDAATAPNPEQVATKQIAATLDGLDVNLLRELVAKADAAKVLLASLEDRAERGEVGPAVVGFEMNTGMITRAAKKLNPDAAPERTVAAQVKRWLAMLMAGGMKTGTVQYYRYSIARFAAWIGQTADVEGITGTKLEEFFGYLGVQVAERKMAVGTAAETMKSVRQFVGRLAELSVIPLPGNLNSRRLKFEVGTTTITTFTDDEVKRVLASCVGRLAKTRAYLLLMLNCGMTQKDVAELRNDEVDWKNGTITRQRSKRKGRAGALTVTYPLWPETLAELVRHRAAGELALRTGGGKPLVAKWSVGEKMRSYDCVSSAWRAVAKAAAVKKTLKIFRKTAASKLAEHKDYKYYAAYFLAHSPRSVAERHYVKPSEDEFRAAVNWLRSQWM